ncbi:MULTISPECIES: hypothetical protein [unclassified Streptomyces]|uniref:hypothetical protein n=1 Tax=unclassified Streptomyces TaxID=2593676 RepID=UPI00278BE785|nr:MULTISPECIES: hypothetical protein [unclassified Streptomyces]
MTSTRRTLTALLLTVGAAALATPAAQAADATPAAGGGAISPTATLDSLSTMAIPEDQQAQLPSTAEQLSGLNHLNDLHQATDLVAPVTNLLPAVQ